MTITPAHFGLTTDNAKHARVWDTLQRYVPDKALEACAAARTTVRVLAPNERYAQASGALSAMNLDVDSWPAPPAGLFVVAERTLYLRSVSPMTIVHEFGHALDCALGGGTYLSGYQSKVRSAFRSARSFVSPYAATGLDEFFAECFRAYCEANDGASPWPKVSRNKLKALNPAMHALFARVFRGERP